MMTAHKVGKANFETPPNRGARFPVRERERWRRAANPGRYGSLRRVYTRAATARGRAAIVAGRRSRQAERRCEET